MLFNTFEFAIFFIIVYGLYVAFSHKWQNKMLLVASYVFYSAWDYRFLLLIFISTILDYTCGLKIYESKNSEKKKLFLFLSIFGNLAILGFFKYFDFFASNLQVLLSFFGFSIQPHFLHIILPVGISFYTFQTMSYTIDIYRGEMKPTKKFFDFALFVAFFPQLVAGPIERAKRLLPQILLPRKITLEKFYGGCYLIFWGLFQKIFIADNLARIVNPVFSSKPPYNGALVLIALYAFAFQILCDFAGYSNIARGLGKCMGFDLTINFNLPYFATNPKEFWKRWHISLSSWLKDYLYVPLGGNRKGTFNTYRNLTVTMLLGGLWHGASWTFIAWGAYHSLLLIIYRIQVPFLATVSLPMNDIFKKIWFYLKTIFFFNLICIGWLFFRAESIKKAFMMLRDLFLNFQLTDMNLANLVIKLILIISILLIVQIVQFSKNDLNAVFKSNVFYKVAFYSVCFYLLLIYGSGGGKEFIYFQF